MADSNLPTNAGVIVALLPDSTYTRVRPTISDHHLTVLYLGRYDDPQITTDKLGKFWRALTETKAWQKPIKAEITAEAMFDTPDGWAHVDLIDGPELPRFRCLVEEFLEIYDLPINRMHGFLPHITRRYLPPTNRDHIELSQRKGRMKFKFDKAALWAGDTRFEIEL